MYVMFMGKDVMLNLRPKILRIEGVGGNFFYMNICMHVILFSQLSAFFEPLLN